MTQNGQPVAVRRLSGGRLEAPISNREATSGQPEATRCPKAICGHRFLCPVVSVLIFFCKFDVNTAAALKGAMSLLYEVVTSETWLRAVSFKTLWEL